MYLGVKMQQAMLTGKKEGLEDVCTAENAIGSVQLMYLEVEMQQLRYGFDS